jgi:uncharacterized protein with HEPN domain
MPPRNLASVLDDVIDSANFISVRRDRLTLDLFLQDEEAQTMFERKFEIVGEALGLLRKHAPETFGKFCHRWRQIAFVARADQA